MTADSTLFSDNDLTEPDYGGQVVAWSIGNDPLIPETISQQRRVFQCVSQSAVNIWVDEHGYPYYFSDLRDIVIINRGVKL